MKVVGLMAARNEEWCISLTLRAALMWCDAIVVGLHACTDRTGDIVTEIIHECDEDKHYGKVAWVEYSGGTWEEMAHRQGMLGRAREIRTLGGEGMKTGLIHERPLSHHQNPSMAAKPKNAKAL